MTTARRKRVRQTNRLFTKREVMTPAEVADLLSLKPSTVMEYARRGELPSIVLGRNRRFLRADVEAALMAKRGAA